jgi:valyl-tRNA synthetase
VRNLGRIEKLEFGGLTMPRPAKAATTFESGFEVVVSLAGLVDVEAEVARIGKELARVEKDIEFFGRKLNDPKFVDKAPEAIIAKDRAKLADAEAARTALVAARARLEETDS